MATDYAALAKQYGGTVASGQSGAAPPTPAQSGGEIDYTALAAQHGGQAEQKEPVDNRGFFQKVGDVAKSAVEQFTGTERMTPESTSLPDWAGMPELNQMSVASLKSGLGTIFSSPKETVQVIQANFPGVQIRQDEKGNFILKSSIDQNEYAIKPGFQMSDVPRAVAGVAAFTPAGRATTIPGALAAGAGTQAAIEASQVATGGNFDASDVAFAAGANAAGPIAQRISQAVTPVAQKAIQQITNKVSKKAPVQSGSVVTEEQIIAPVSTQPAVVAPVPTPAPAAPTAQSIAKDTTQAFEDIGNLARKASGIGPGSSVAKAKLAELAQVNTEAKAAADRLGMDLPFDVFSDNPQIRSAVGLTRSATGSEAEAAWIGTVRNAIGKADDITKKFDAEFVEGRPAPGVASQHILDSLKQTQKSLSDEASAIYQKVDESISKTTPVEFTKLSQVLNDIKTEVGAAGLSTQERRLGKMIEDGATYGRLLREKNLIGQAMAGKQSTYSNLDSGALKRLYGALAEDQLSNVASIGGNALRQELRGANLLTAKKKALETRIVGAFGKEIDGSVANLMQSAIKSASKGDAAQFNKLMKVVPPELRKETVATALAAVSASGKSAQEGSFGFSEFAKAYRGLRANPPVYKQIIEALGSDTDPVLRDLYEISKRITDARAQVLTTGKANQALANAMQAEGLVQKVMHSSMAQRGAGAAASMLGPLGGSLAPDIVKFMNADKDAIKAAGKLFASPEMQKLATEAATKAKVSPDVVKKVALSKRFIDFAKAVNLPQDLDARIQWLQSAMQTGQQFKEEQ